MRLSSWPVIAAAVALPALCAAPDLGAAPVLGAVPARAAVAAAPLLPADVTASQCLAGGGVIVVSADGDGTGPLTARCRGGAHDGESVV